MIETPRFLETRELSAAVVHIIVPRSGIREVMGPGLQELHAALASQGVLPAGPWFTHHRQMFPDRFDFEIGIPITQSVAAAGRVRMGSLPSGMVARTVLHGGYEQLPTAWPQLDAWIVAQGRTPGPSLWETYVVGPGENPDPANWRTELTRPLAT
jgi:effector-binding domain-containing protein